MDLDFTSSLYLGLRHASRRLRPWAQLTSGRPAALGEPEQALTAAARLAGLQGCSSAVLGPSTLHLFMDLFALLARGGAAFYLDDGSYPLAGWAAERAAGLGARVETFAHRCPADLALRLNRHARRGPAVIVADGVCPCCWKPAPLAGYLALAKATGGLLVIDDTQALGLLGRSPGVQTPYGQGGGGSLRFAGLAGEPVVMVSSLAKGFGAPLAALSGSARLIAWFKAESETRTHCSPPSLAAVAAAARALWLNEHYGEALRRRLAANVRLFRRLADEHGLGFTGGLFPVQTLADGREALDLYKRLLAQGVNSVLTRGKQDGRPRVSFVLTARHRSPAIERVISILAHSGG